MDMEEQFRQPMRQYSPAPLWFWYGRLDAGEIRRQIDEMVDKHVYNAFMHARAYLLTPYLEDEWWHAVTAAVEHARKVGFFPWIYDEYAWPSGTAGSVFRYGVQKPSRVLAKGEANMAKGLRVREQAIPVGETVVPAFPDEKEAPVSVSVMQTDAEGRILYHTLLPADGRIPAELPPVSSGGWRVMAFYRTVIPACVDYLNPSAIRDFIRFTHEEYKLQYAGDFGGVIPGVFFDEIYNAGTPIVWSDAFAREFRQRKGYDILPLLPLLMHDADRRAEEVRDDYFEVLAALYEEAFFSQLSRWCGDNGLMLTGHTEEWIVDQPLRQGDYFHTMRHLEIPGADCHDYRYRYPRRISPTEPKDSVSVARLYGKGRCMSESMGGGGWATPLQEFKRGIHMLAAMGINMFILHGFYYENEHQGSQSDWPASFFFQNPYWKYFGRFADYVARISYMGTVGRPVVDVGIYYPIREVRRGYCAGRPSPAARRLAETYSAVMDACVSHQIDADFIDDDSLLSGRVEDSRLVMGSERIAVLLLPDCLCASPALESRLREFAAAGGHLLFYTLWGGGDKAPRRTIFPDAFTVTDAVQLVERLRAMLSMDLTVEMGDSAELYYNHRSAEGRESYFLVNGRDECREVTLRFRSAGVPFRYDIETGGRQRLVPLRTEENFTEVKLAFHEDEAFYLVFCFPEEGAAPLAVSESPMPEYAVRERLAPDGPWAVVPLAPSYDRDWTPGGEETDLAIPVAEFRSTAVPGGERVRICNTAGSPGCCGRHLGAWQAFWITRRPGWYDNSCRRVLTFRKRFRLTAAPEEARICVAAVGSFTVRINGQPAGEGAGWTAPAQLDIHPYLHAGENLIAVRVDNPDHIDGRDVLEAQTLPADGLTSLLLEGTVRQPDGEVHIVSDGSWIAMDGDPEGWDDPALNWERDAVHIDVTQISTLQTVDDRWVYAYERGRPPLLPWGQIPLFGRNVGFPAEIEYRVTLPAGAVMLYLPQVEGSYVMDVDHESCTSADFVGGILPLPDDGRSRTLCIRVRAAGFSNGLKSDVKVRMRERCAPLGDWCADGLDWFSGRVRYRNTFTLRQPPQGGWALELGQVNFHAEVWVNGRLADVRLWKPYRADVTSLLHAGENEVCVIVSNLAANRKRFGLVDEGRALAWNRYWNEDNIRRDARNLRSGLFGPVELRRE